VDIQIVVFDGFDEIDAIAPFEVLTSAGFAVSLVTLDRPAQVVSMHGLRLDITATLDRPDAVVVPGGGWLNRAPEGTWTQVQRGALPAALAELAPQVQWMASVCTGSMLLAHAGLLTERYATTNANAHDELRPHIREVVPERVVDDGDRITAAGLTAGIDLALHLIQREKGTAARDALARSIEYTPQGRTWHAPPRYRPAGPPTDGRTTRS